MKSPSGSGNSSSFLSFMPIHAGSTTRMSSDSSLHRPSSVRGYSPESQTEYGRVMPSGRVISLRPRTKSSPVRGLSTSTVHDMVPSVPVFGSLSANIESRTGEVPSAAFKVNCSSDTPEASCSTRQRTICAKAETTDGMRLLFPRGGKGMSKGSSPPALASASSLSLSQAWSFARMSIDSVLASAPRPRGCSLPLTQTSKGCGAPFSI